MKSSPYIKVFSAALLTALFGISFVKTVLSGKKEATELEQSTL